MVLRLRSHPPPGLPLRGCHPLWRTIPGPFGSARIGGERFRLNTTSQACLPRPFRFGLIPFHSPLLRESRFDFPSSAYSDASFRRVPTPSLRRVFPKPKLGEGYPFSDPRINGCMLLPGAYRRLPRPSSAVEPIHPPGSVHVPRPQLPVGTVCDLPVTHSQPNTVGLMHSPKR
jgi:hypothetical protein